MASRGGRVTAGQTYLVGENGPELLTRGKGKTATGFRKEYAETGGHLYYVNDEGPLPGATSITAIQESVGGSDGLVNWAVKTTLTAAFDTYSETQDQAASISAAWRAKNAARDLGTAVHAAVDRFNKGREALALTEQTAAHVAHYGQFLYDHRVTVIASEQMVANLEHRYGGSFDVLAEVDGALTLIDVKTGKARASYRLQLNAYAMAELRGEEGGEPLPMEKVDRLLCLYLTADGYEPHFFDPSKGDSEHFLKLLGIYHQANTWRDAA